MKLVTYKWVLTGQCGVNRRRAGHLARVSESGTEAQAHMLCAKETSMKGVDFPEAIFWSSKMEKEPQGAGVGQLITLLIK